MRKAFSILTLFLLACPSPDFDLGTEETGYDETESGEMGEVEGEADSTSLDLPGDGDEDCNPEAWDACYPESSEQDLYDCRFDCVVTELGQCDEQVCIGLCEKADVIKKMACNEALGEESCAPDYEDMYCELTLSMEKIFCFGQLTCDGPDGLPVEELEACTDLMEELACD